MRSARASKLARASKFALLVLYLASLGGCFFSPPVDPGPRLIGTVQKAAGTPSVIRRNQRYLIGAQSRIFEGDIVETDDLSRTRIEMIDQSIIRLGEGTHFVFHQYNYVPGMRSPVAKMTFTSGSVQINPRGIAASRNGNFEVATPLATVGAKTADFWAGFIFGNRILDVTMLKGESVYVSNDFGSTRIDAVGYGTTVAGGNGPQLASKWPGDKLAAARDATAI